MDSLKYRFRQQAGNPEALDLYIYSEVTGDYYEWEGWDLRKVTSETSCDYFRAKLAEYADVKQINLYINSVGGSVLEGYGIYCQLKRHPAQITAYIDGFACSIASVIACAADHVIGYPNSMYMLHNMADSVYGNAVTLRKAADDLDRIMEGNRQVYIAKSGGKLEMEQLTAMLDAETWLTAAECLECGLIDEIKGEGGMSEAQAANAMQRVNGELKKQLAKRQMLMQMLESAPPLPNAKQQGAEPAPPAEPKEPVQGKQSLMQMFAAYQKK